MAENARSRRDAAAAARRRLVAHVAAGGTTDLAAGCMRQDSRVYTDPERHARERDRIFHGWPLIAGLAGDVAAPGDILLFEEMGHSILITRDAAGALRGYRNMCAHRGARLFETERCGARLRQAAIVCPFHGWRYDSDGRVVAAPGATAFLPAELAERRLVQVPVAEWNGLLLVMLETGNELAAERFFASAAEPLGQLDLGVLRHVQSTTIEAACNWKLAVDTYAENYHFGVLHGPSIAKAYVSGVAAFDGFGPHWRLWFPERSLVDLVGRPEKDWPAPLFKAVFFLFPNTILVFGVAGREGTMVRVYRIFPGSAAGRTVCRVSVYADIAPDLLPPGAFADEAKSEVTLEDYRVAEGEQANLETAPAGFSFLYGRNEIGVQAFHMAVAAALGEPAPAIL